MKRALCVALPLAALACSEPTPPSRADTYPFADVGDVFHWPPERLPVRFYAPPQGNLPVVVQQAIDGWASLFLYGEFTGELVGDSAQADVIVYPDSSGSCVDRTQLPPTDASNRFTEPFRVWLCVVMAARLPRHAIHEVGHALGLFQHSLDPLDIMYAPPDVAQPSERDRRTVQVLYHTSPTLFPPP